MTVAGWPCLDISCPPSFPSLAEQRKFNDRLIGWDEREHSAVTVISKTSLTWQKLIEFIMNQINVQQWELKSKS